MVLLAAVSEALSDDEAVAEALALATALAGSLALAEADPLALLACVA